MHAHQVASKEAMLRKKEAELNKKEKELKALEQRLKDNGVVLKKKNWPICYPLVHHDIQGDIPERSRRVVREIYACWWVSCSGWEVQTTSERSHLPFIRACACA